MERNVANDVAETLKASGIDKFFMLTGGDQPLWIALRESGVAMIVGRSEASAVYMADGYARAGGKPAVVYGQAGPGAANVAAALADPYWAQSPVVAVTGATDTRFRHVNEYQDLNHFAMFEPVTRWNARAESPEQVAPMLRQGLQMAWAGTHAPTHVDIPKDFFAVPSKGLARKLPPLVKAPFDWEGDATVMRDMAEQLRRAKKPVILVGEGVRFSRAWNEAAAFSEAAGIPMIATMGGKPAVLAAHPNFVGVAGRYSSITANRLLAEADTVLVLGSRLGGLATRGYSIPSAAAAILQIDSDDAAFANRYDPATCLRADIRHALPRIGQLLGGEAVAPDWLARCRAEANEWQTAVQQAIAAPDKAGVVSPLGVLSSLAKVADDITLVADTGYMAAWTGVLFPVARHDSFFRATGSLGWALPASLGVQMAKGGKTVCVTGDGGAGYHLADIETAVRYRLPAIIVILNNDCLAFEYHEQKYRWKGQVVEEANNFAKVNYADAARALGAEAARVDGRESFDAALKAGLNSANPMVIEVVTDREAFPPVTNFDAVMERKI